MTDYLLVHGAGQGAWSWGAVWGHLTAPAEHPPRLYRPGRAGRVYPLDLPGHGADADGDTAEVRLEECVHAITRAVERENLKDVVLVGHGFSGGLILQAASQLPQPPKRLVLISGIIPVSQHSMLSALPWATRKVFRFLAVVSRLLRREFLMPPWVISRILCNGMDAMEVVQSLGFFGPLPTRAITAKLSLDDGPPPCPVTYVVLSKSKVVPQAAQEHMAQRIPGVDIITVDSCHQVTLYRPKEMAEILLGYA